MPQSQYRARQVRSKTQEVVEYDHDESKPGKPLHILIPGGLIALASLGVIILIIYQTWFESRLANDTGVIFLVVMIPFYVGGVFLFSYGYELYNIPRAIRLTVIIVFVTLAAVVIIAVLFLVLGASGKESSSGSSSRGASRGSSSKRSSGRSSGSSSGGRITGGGSKPQAKSVSFDSSSSEYRHSDAGDAILLGGSGRTRTVTREVVKEVEVPMVPKPVDCPYCSRSYVPVENKYVCPGCGAATPQDLIVESQEPGQEQ